MFAHIGWGVPSEGREADAERGMRALAERLAGSPGLLEIHLLKDPATGQLTGLSLWRDVEAFRAGMAQGATDGRAEPGTWSSPPTGRAGVPVYSWRATSP